MALASAAPLSTFLRLRFDVQSAAVGGADDEHEPERGRRACRALCSAIATACDAAGIAVVAVPQRTDSLQVLCHKTVAARAYKTIVESNAQQQWRLVVSSIKQHASMLTNDDAQELSEAMDACLQITLQKAGWQRLSTCRYVKLMPAAGITTAPQAAVQAGSFLAAEPGTWQTLQHVTAGLQAEPPADLSLLMCDAGQHILSSMLIMPCRDIRFSLLCINLLRA